MVVDMHIEPLIIRQNGHLLRPGSTSKTPTDAAPIGALYCSTLGQPAPTPGRGRRPTRRQGLAQQRLRIKATAAIFDPQQLRKRPPASSRLQLRVKRTPALLKHRQALAAFAVVTGKTCGITLERRVQAQHAMLQGM